MILPHALQFLEYGFSPIPLIRGGKIPTIPQWKPYVEVKPPEPLVREWFKNDDVNLGIVIREDYIVVDFDNFGSFKVWEIKNPALSQTYTVETSKGFHLYFHAQEKPEATFHFDTGELKATGYVVAPPSIHQSGKMYREILPLPILRIDSWQDLNLRRIKKSVSRTPHARKVDGVGVIAEIKRRLPVVDYLDEITTVCADKSGKWMAKCPFHDDRNPSMIVDHNAYCFSYNCTVGHQQLDVINVYSLYNKVPLKEAIRQLAERLDI